MNSKNIEIVGKYNFLKLLKTNFEKTDIFKLNMYSLLQFEIYNIKFIYN